jgi:DNA repair exonuclease SbcCD ATPase subunit
VEFQTTSEALAALKMNNYEYKRKGRITVQPVQFRVQDDLPNIALATPRRLENQQQKKKVESDASLQTELARLQQVSVQYKQRIESEAQIRIQNDRAAHELNRLRLENEQLRERAQSDRRLYAELTQLRQEVQRYKGQQPQSETQVKDDISALRHENQQLKRKHYIDASDKLELVDLRRKDEQLKLDIAANSQEMKRTKQSLDLLQQDNAGLRLKLSKDSNVELEDSKREANSLRDEIDQIKANHAMQAGFTKREANALRDENRQSELESAKKTIQSLETQIKGMRSYFQAAATVFEVPRDEGIQRRQQEQPNDGTTTIVKAELRNEP